MELQGKVAIITGGTRGIGFEISKHLAKEGINLAICSKNPRRTELLIKELKNINENIDVIIQKVDVREEKEVVEFIKLVEEKFGRIDILVNNAGLVRCGLLTEVTEQDWDLMIDTNLKGTFIFSKYSIPAMKKNNYGHIINISSIAGKSGFPYLSGYCASKYGLRGFSLAVKEEIREHNISLTILYPGAVDTDIWDDIPGDYDFDKMVQPENIAETVLFALKNSSTCTIDEIQITPKSGKL